MEKPKMTHKKVRRISFMETFSKRGELRGDAINAKAIEAPGLAPDHDRHHTMGGNGPGV
jgi:hypothetical protein